MSPSHVPQLSFSLDLREPARRTIRVSLVAHAVASREFFLPAWTPGSYLIREHSRHLGGFRAGQPGGGAYPWEKSAKNRFRVAAPPGEALELEYTLYAHDLSVRTPDLTDRHAFLAGAAVFLWPVGLRAAETIVDVHHPEGWQLATELSCQESAPGRHRFFASSLDELVDAPILAGTLRQRSFVVAGKPHHLVLEGLEPISEPESLVRDTKAVVEHAAAVFGGELPYDEYRFLCMFTDSGRGGLEHRASSALIAPRTTFRPAKAYGEFLSLIAHEFFHVWNVKRMRPAELWDLDYEQENHTELLWLAEGFTAYYDDHLCRRAGIWTTERYLEILADTIRELRQTPGRLQQTLAQASFDAWIRLYRPDENTRNSTLSYYGNGALAALCLDLRLRERTDGAHSLDDFMRQLHDRTFLAGRGYTHEDVVAILSEVAREDLRTFVDSLVHRPLEPDFAACFAPFGLALREKPGTGYHIGVHFKPGSMAIASVLADGPADRAGLMPADEILAVAGLRVQSSTFGEVFDQTAEANKPLEVLIARRGRVRTVEVEPESRSIEKIEIVPDPAASPSQIRLRRAWLFES